MRHLTRTVQVTVKKGDFMREAGEQTVGTVFLVSAYSSVKAGNSTAASANSRQLL